jgi:hypothetical protein
MGGTAARGMVIGSAIPHSGIRPGSAKRSRAPCSGSVGPQGSRSEPKASEAHPVGSRSVVFDADGVLVKTVTFTANGCALDWVLVASDAREFEDALPDFDAWWRTLAVEPRGDAPAATASDGDAPKETP